MEMARSMLLISHLRYDDYVRKFQYLMISKYSITEIWSVPYVGTVVNGILNSGQVKAGDAVYLGPDANGNWHSTAIKSIQRKRYVVFLSYFSDIEEFPRANVTSAEAGQW